MSSTVCRGQQMIGLEDEPDRGGCVSVRSGLVEPRAIGPIEQQRSRGGRSSSPMMFISVDLPDPDGPRMATNSPGRTVSEVGCSRGTGDPPRARKERSDLVQFDQHFQEPLERASRLSVLLADDDEIGRPKPFRFDDDVLAVFLAPDDGKQDRLAVPQHPERNRTAREASVRSKRHQGSRLVARAAIGTVIDAGVRCVTMLARPSCPAATFRPDWRSSTRRCR